MTLNAPAVNAVAVEASAFALLAEWLAYYFDGESHPLGTQEFEEALTTETLEALTTEEGEALTESVPGISFPVAHIRFQQSDLPKLGTAIGLTVVWVVPGKARRDWETVAGQRQEMVTLPVTWFFFVRAEGPAGSTGENAQQRCRTGSDRLYALLQNSHATRPLAAKGIHKLCPDSPGVMSEGKGGDKPDLNYVVRMIQCRGLLRYPVYSQPTS